MTCIGVLFFVFGGGRPIRHMEIDLFIKEVGLKCVALRGDFKIPFL